MKIVKATVEAIMEIDPYKKIEKIGRTCYKSEDKITEGSCYKFVEGLIKRQHLAMLEHAVVHFHVTVPSYLHFEEFFNYIERARLSRLALIDGISEDEDFIVTLSLSHLYNPRWDDYTWIAAFRECFESKQPTCYETWYIRMISDEGMIDLITEGYSENAPEEIKYHTLWSCKFICDRGVSHEIVRHRRSFAQESTRYCNYTQGKFGGELTFIEPSTWDTWADDAKEAYLSELVRIEDTYFKLIATGLQPQQARAVLPNSLKTEVIMSAYLNEWDHFFDVRSRGTTGAPHPDMKFVADKALELYEEENSIQ